jgi:hypothetical protein
MAPTSSARPWRSWFAILWTCAWGGVTISLLLVAISYWTGFQAMEFRQNELDAGMGAFMVAVVTAAITPAGLLMTRAKRRAEDMRPFLSMSAPKRSRLPRSKSTARQPMVELAEAEDGLAELLRQLGDLPDGPALPHHVLEHAWYTASDTADRLREVAARLEAVELAARHAPPREWAAFEDGAGSLRLHLDQGLDAYRALIGAAGRLALSGTPVVASTELVEATESLAGLAEALRELSPPEA